MSFFEDAEDLYLSSAQDSLRATNGDEALHALGWTDLLECLDSDPEARSGVFAYFRAQGRGLASSSALGLLMVQPYSELLGDLPTTSAIEHGSARRGDRRVVVGAPQIGDVLIDQPGTGISLAGITTLELRSIGGADGLALAEIESDVGTLPVSLTEPQVLPQRERRLQLGRIALAYEILGAAEGALASAVQHPRDREQFGEPIGRFQAIRHLLAAARVDCAAIQALAEYSIDIYPALPPLHDAILKAVAGRNARRICERSLQVLGATGFTTEHAHHRFHSRVLVLDSLLGTSATLSQQLGLALRTSEGVVPNLSVPLAGMLTD